MPSSSIVRATVTVSRSTWVSVPASGFTTDTASAPTATSVTPGARSVARGPDRAPLPTRQRVPSGPDVTQAASSPTAIAGDRDRNMCACDRTCRSLVEADDAPVASEHPHSSAPAATATAGTAVAFAVTAPVLASMRTTAKSGVTAQSASSVAASGFRPGSTDRPSCTAEERRRARSQSPGRGGDRGRQRADELRLVRRSPFATHTAPGATATSVGVAPVENVSTAPEDSSIRRSVRASASTTRQHHRQQRSRSASCRPRFGGRSLRTRRRRRPCRRRSRPRETPLRPADQAEPATGGGDEGVRRERDQKRSPPDVARLCDLPCLERRELAPKPLDLELEETLRPIEILELEGAELAHLRVQRKLVFDELTRRIGEEHLPAVTDGTDTRGPMNTEAHVALARRTRLAGVQSHPHPELDPVGPRMTASARWASTALATASPARPNATKNESPWVSTSRPSWASKPRAGCAGDRENVSYTGPSCLRSRVDPRCR